VASRNSKRKIGGGKGFPTIRCSFCGQEILLVPNVKLMSEAIEAHAIEHARKVCDPIEAEAEAGRVLDSLIAKVLEKASKTKN
jgi:hypothetical protein